MRSASALVATIWFAYNALSFLPQGAAVYANEGAQGGIDGDPAAVAITWAARTTFVGLALIAVALIEWSKIVNAITRPVLMDTPR